MERRRAEAHAIDLHDDAIGCGVVPLYLGRQGRIIRFDIVAAGRTGRDRIFIGLDWLEHLIGVLDLIRLDRFQFDDVNGFDVWVEYKQLIVVHLIPWIVVIDDEGLVDAIDDSQ